MPAASLVTWLDQHQGASSAFLAAALIAVTVYYAIQNARMAKEMRRARGAAIHPKLALDFRRLGPTAATPEIRSVGSGAAFDIDATLAWIPLKGVEAPTPRRWRTSYLAPGERRDFLGGIGTVNDSLNVLPTLYSAVQLTGTMKDAAGTVHEIAEEFADLRDWRATMVEMQQRWEDPSPEKRFASAFADKLASEFRAVVSSTDDVARAVRELTPPEPAGAPAGSGAPPDDESL